jgi:hypothetical protein
MHVCPFLSLDTSRERSQHAGIQIRGRQKFYVELTMSLAPLFQSLRTLISSFVRRSVSLNLRAWRTFQR